MSFEQYKFGVEIEYASRTHGQRELVNALALRGMRAQVTGYGQSSAPGTWNASTDSTCGFELISPILSGENGLDQVRSACAALSECSPQITPGCGLHVHISGFQATETKTLRNVVRRFINFEDTFDMLQPASRRGNGNTYCQSNAQLFGRDPVARVQDVWTHFYDLERDAMVRKVSPTRYYKLNLQSLMEHGTIEFRHHSGTVDAEKITHWVKFLCAFIDVATAQERLWKRPVGTVESPKARLKKMLRGVPGDTARHITARFNRFQGDVNSIG